MLLLFDPENVSRVYLGTDTRATAILFGAALATLLPMDTTFSAGAIRRLDFAGLVSVLLLGVAWWKLAGEEPLLYHGGFWVTEIAALVLIACCVAGERSMVARALSFKPL